MNTDRRTSPRIPVDLSTLLTSKKAPPKICRIQDFCDGGMLLALPAAESDEENPWTPGDWVEIRFTVETQGAKRRFQVKAEVARAHPGTLGVAFHQIDADVLSALREISDAAQVQHAVTPRPTSVAPELANKLLQQMRRQMELKLSGLLSEFFDVVSAELLAAAEHAANNQEENTLFELNKELKVRKTPLRSHYRNHLLERFDLIAAGQIPDDAKPGDAAKAKKRLSLVDKEEFDDWLVMVTLISRADDKFDEPLYELSMRLSETLGLHLNKENNPAGPAAICRAFHAAAGEVRLGMRLRQLVFGLFDSQYLGKLGHFYNDLNKLFVEQGVLPQIEYQVPEALKSKRSEEKKKPAQKEPPPTEPAAEPEPPAPRQASEAPKEPPTDAAPAQPAEQEFAADTPEAPAKVAEPEPEKPRKKSKPSLFSAAKNLFGLSKKPTLAEPGGPPATQAEGPQNAAPAEPPAPEVTDPGQFMDALSHLQTREQGETGELASLSERVSEALQAQPDGGAVGVRERELLGVVENLLTNIQRDLMMAKGLQRWLRKLEVPMLKAAFLDPDAVSSEENPVGRIVNQLEKLGHAVDDDGKVINRQLGEKIDHLFDRLLEDFDWDFAPFDQAADELESLMAPQEAAYEKSLHRIVQSCDGQQKLLESREAVTNHLTSILSRAPVPKVLAEIDREVWRQLLLQVHLREGADSKHWKDYLGGMERLLSLSHKTEAVKPGPAEVDAMRTLKHGFEHAGANPGKVDHWMRETAQLITGRNPGMERIEIHADQLKTEVEQALPNFDDAQRQAPDDFSPAHWRSLLLEVLSLEVDDWLEQEDGAKGPQALRLIWIGKDHRRFVLVNRRGLKELDLSLPELARRLGLRTLVSIPDPDLSLTERASYRTLEQMHDGVARQATRDPLTGLLNRRAIGQQVQRVMEEVRTDAGEAAFLHIKADHLELINDSFGFEAEEDYLHAFAEALETAARPSGMAARLGDASFGLLLPDQDQERAARRAEELRATLGGVSAGPEDNPQSLTVSIGLTAITPETGDPSQVLKEADAACDQATAEGRNRVHLYKAADRTLTERYRSATLLNQFTEAVKHDRLELLAQPIVQLVAADPAAPKLYEIFLRLPETPDLTADLIQAAEHYSRMPAVDRWVVNHVLQWLSDSPPQPDALYIVNLSHASLSDLEFLRFTMQAVEDRRVHPGQICFELTETARLESSALVLRHMHALNEAGFRFSLDDFGSGAASFSQLKKLPVDYLKIDGSFVNQITRSETDLALIRSINEVAHFFGKQTVAEQVEDAETLELLKTLQVDFAQGRFLHAPAPLETIRAAAS